MYGLLAVISCGMQSKPGRVYTILFRHSGSQITHGRARLNSR